MEDPLPIVPFAGPAAGQVRVPGSKSLTNRALVLAALGRGIQTIEGALFSRDTHILVESLRRLGFAVVVDEARSRIRVEGAGGRMPRAQATLDVGNAGTAARFLTALVCLHPAGRYTFDGDAAMRARPMAGLLDALVAQGARFHFAGRPGHFPFAVETAGLRCGVLTLDAGASSQMLTALLLAGTGAAGDLELHAPGVRPAFVRMTLEMLAACGVRSAADWTRGVFKVAAGEGGPNFPDRSWLIEADFSAASYFLALPLVTGGWVRVAGLRTQTLQGDACFAGVLEDLGLVIERGDNGWTARRARAPRGEPIRQDFGAYSDTFLTLAALAPLLPAPVRIEGIGHTRMQETDRIAAMATEGRKLGAVVREEPEALEIAGDAIALRRAAAAGVSIATYRDHRVAMSFAVAGVANPLGDGRPWLRIMDPACCGKTFPGFFDELASLRAQSERGRKST